MRSGHIVRFFCTSQYKYTTETGKTSQTNEIIDCAPARTASEPRVNRRGAHIYRKSPNGESRNRRADRAHGRRASIKNRRGERVLEGRDGAGDFAFSQKRDSRHLATPMRLKRCISWYPAAMKYHPLIRRQAGCSSAAPIYLHLI